MTGLAGYKEFKEEFDTRNKIRRNLSFYKFQGFSANSCRKETARFEKFIAVVK